MMVHRGEGWVSFDSDYGSGHASAARSDEKLPLRYLGETRLMEVATRAVILETVYAGSSC